MIKRDYVGKIKVLDNSSKFLLQGPIKFKKEKSVIAEDYNEGVLRMVDIPCFIQSLKLTLVRNHILKDGKWTSSLTKHIFEIDKLLNCG